MFEQTIILLSLVIALGATLGLYLLKAAKQTAYKGDERWELIQVKSGSAANVTLWLLLVLLAVSPLFIDGQTLFTFQRVRTFGLLYIGLRNLVELSATLYFDRRL